MAKGLKGKSPALATCFKSFIMFFNAPSACGGVVDLQNQGFYISKNVNSQKPGNGKRGQKNPPPFQLNINL